MNSVDIALDNVWPAELRTARLLLRPVTAQDADVVRELLTDERTRAYLGGPASPERVAARQAAYPQTPGAWAIVRVAEGRAVGLASRQFRPAVRRPGRGLLPAAALRLGRRPGEPSGIASDERVAAAYEVVGLAGALSFTVPLRALTWGTSQGFAFDA
ncbi:GNAT family N-acetyltransferase [Streptomyces halstedii]|uniref:GNAT family N-acetyltransferase n=1 Tax=Streptomyces halstedii TaxID=1944 RepID=UPI0038704EE5